MSKKEFTQKRNGLSMLEVFNIKCMILNERPTTKLWQYFIEEWGNNDDLNSLYKSIEKYRTKEFKRQELNIKKLMKKSEYTL